MPGLSENSKERKANRKKTSRCSSPTIKSRINLSQIKRPPISERNFFLFHSTGIEPKGTGKKKPLTIFCKWLYYFKLFESIARIERASLSLQDRTDLCHGGERRNHGTGAVFHPHQSRSPSFARVITVHVLPNASPIFTASRNAAAAFGACATRCSITDWINRK